MAKVFSAPSDIQVPRIDYNLGREVWEANDEKYLQDLRDFIQKRKPSKDPAVGKTIKFPMADSYAMYMVASVKPLELVHVPLWDAWSFEYAHRLTLVDVRQKIAQDEAMKKLFSK